MSDDDAGPEPADQLDAMERRVLGATQDRFREDPHEGTDGPGSPAPGEPGDPATFDLDLEPEDQGTAGAAGEDPG